MTNKMSTAERELPVIHNKDGNKQCTGFINTRTIQILRVCWLKTACTEFITDDFYYDYEIQNYSLAVEPSNIQIADAVNEIYQVKIDLLELWPQ